ncbi:hypothetical protein [Novipirellula artificiosorum]|uniref:hypothetical protein n=1 Tax=Novipirellula artificiosorum TaxID=2528016 RepID=UPI0011B663F3|nr:hypothetical protein [Novipirellula artificiosorum]
MADNLQYPSLTLQPPFHGQRTDDVAFYFPRPLALLFFCGPSLRVAELVKSFNLLRESSIVLTTSATAPEI